MNKKLFTSLLTAITAVSASNAAIVSVDGTLPGVVALGGNQFEIPGSVTLAAGDEYILEGTTFVTGELVIEPGVVVRGQPVDATEAVPGSLCVSKGGFIDAQGTQTSPIIFTTAADTNRERYQAGDVFLDAAPATNPLPPFSIEGGVEVPNSGLWGAVTLLGCAPTNRGPVDTGISGEAFIEGFSQAFPDLVTYGGILPHDTSGILSFVSIRHTGLTVTEGDEQQGLTLGGVGSGTILENLDIYCSADDGIEIFGGTVALCQVIISYVNDDGFDLDQGWTGTAQSVFVLASNLVATLGGDLDLITTASVAEWDGEDGNGTLVSDDTTGRLTTTGQPFTAPTMYNFTFFADGVSGVAATIDTNFGGNLLNSIFVEVGAGSIQIDNTGAQNPSTNGFGFAGVRDRLEQGTFNVDCVSFVTPAGSGLTAAGVAVTTEAEAVILNDNTGALTGVTALNSNFNTLAELNPAANNFPFFFGALLGGVFNDQTAQNGINPVPLNAATANVRPVVGPCLKPAAYRGAFPQGTSGLLFTTGWSALNVRGILVDTPNGVNVL